MSYSVYLVKNRAGFFLDFEHPTCKGLISRILLRGKPRQQYAPLTGAEARVDEHWREIGASPYPKYEPLTGAIPRTRTARQFVNSFNSLLRRLRPTNELRRSLQPRCKNSINSSAAPSPPSYISILSPFSSPRRPEKRNPNCSLRGSSSFYTLRA